MKALAPAGLGGYLSSGRASRGRRDVSASPTRHFSTLDLGDNVEQGVYFCKSCKILATSVCLWGCGSGGGWLLSALWVFPGSVPPLFPSEEETCFPARHHDLSTGRFLGEKVSLQEGWPLQDHPSPNRSGVTARVSPKRLSQPFLNHVTGT